LIIAKYVALCGIYQKVKAKHQRPAGFFETIGDPYEEMGEQYN